jgi:phage terminase small subunit
MANRRTPDNVLKLKGTFRPDRHASKVSGYEPPAPGYPQPPEYLAGAQLAVWLEVESVMQGCNLYTQADAAKLARYCCIEAEFRADPALFPAAKLAQLRLMERDLYLDPEARAKIGIGTQAGKAANPFAELG